MWHWTHSAPVPTSKRTSPFFDRTGCPAARERDQVLLEWVGTEGVGDFELPHFPVRSLCVHEKAVLLAVEPGEHPEPFENSIVEIAQYGLLVAEWKSA